jgi:hypothetical protein
VSLPFERFGKALLLQVLVPQLGEAFMLGVKLRVTAVVAVAEKTAPLLNAYIVIAPTEGIEVRASGESKLEQQLGVAHRIAVLLSVVAYRDRRQSARPGLVSRLDNQQYPEPCRLDQSSEKEEAHDAMF